MNKDKKVSKKGILLGATILVGGTLAWFTSQDELRNIFSTEDDLNSGIQIEENFPDSVPDKDGNPVYNKPVIPGTDITKEAWIQSRANYEQFIRARIVKEFRDKDGNIVNYYKLNENNLYDYISQEDYDKLDSLEQDSWTVLDIDYIVEHYVDGDAFSPTGKGWLKGTGADPQWYYYNQIVAPNDNDSATDDDKTTNLIDTVKLSDEAGNAYLNLRFDVQILSESVQATGGAIKDTSSPESWGNDAPKELQDLDTTN